jgi:hypothetical protein
MEFALVRNMESNKSDAPNAAIELGFHSRQHWSGVGEPGR